MPSSNGHRYKLEELSSKEYIVSLTDEVLQGDARDSLTVAKNQFPLKDDKLAQQLEIDSRSVFVRNISETITPEMLEEHFRDSGIINRVTLLYHKHSTLPKGYAYIEFNELQSAKKALCLDGSTLNGNSISVTKKRTNLPRYERSLHRIKNHNIIAPNSLKER